VSGEGGCDENHDGDDADGILRVFTVPGNERTAGVSPRAVDPSLKINGQSLAVSNGRVFFRTLAAGQQVSPDDAVLEVLNAGNGSVTTLCKAKQAAVQDGRVAFLRPEAALSTPGCPGGSLNGPADTDLGDDGVQLWTGSGAAQNLGRARARRRPLRDARRGHRRRGGRSRQRRPGQRNRSER
jgi:hypothetical protein